MGNKIKIGLLLCLVMLSIWVAKVFLQESYPDFRVYYYATQNAITHSNPYEAKDPSMSYLYPPVTLFFFLPLATVTVELAEKLWVLLSLLFFILSLSFLYKLLRISGTSIEGLSYLLLCLLFFPLKFTLGMGQVNFLVLFFIVMFFYYYEKKKATAGIFLALGVVTKISPLIFVFYLFYKKEWDIIYVLMTSLLGLGVISLVFFSQATEAYFFSVLPGLSSGWPTAYYNQALTGFLGRITNIQIVRSFVRIAAAILLVSATVWTFSKHKTADFSLLELSSLLPLILIFSSFSWQHHFVLLIPSFIILSHYIIAYVKIRKVLLLFLVLLSYGLVGYNIKQPEVVPLLLASHVFYGCLLLWGIHMYVLQKKL